MRYAISFVLALFIMSCGGSDKDATESDRGTEASPAAAPAGNQYTLTPFEPSTPYPEAKMESMKYENGDWSFEISGDGYELGEQTPDAGSKGCANSAKGQHIHLIVGSNPYVAEYQADFKHEIADGKHAVLAFLSRSYHESIKTDDAYIARSMAISDGLVVRDEALMRPTLFYSRPKGIYEGDDTKKVMLDYFMVNCDQTKHWVKANINGEVHELKDWQPYYIEGLPAGDNTITLTLMEGDKPAFSENNPVTRKFRVNPVPKSN